MINYDKLETNDIDYLIDNKLWDLLSLLDGVFKCSSMKLNYPMENLKLYTLPKLENNMFSVRNYKKFVNFLSGIDYNIIIDAGNVIHSGLVDLSKMTNVLLSSGYKPLVIVHTSHNIKSLMTYSLVYETPKCVNDDLYILTAFYYKSARPLILTNDKYGDHVAKYNLTGHLQDRIVNYTDYNMTLRNYSNCIQSMVNGIYVPLLSVKC
jgi:hypothetical protein